jgi:anion-transporting  ArsA/GET3 family ATPase
VVALTVDPAKRLAESLGADPAVHERQFVSRERLSALGVPAEGDLSVLLLDPEHTLGELVARLSPDPRAAVRITQHPLFRYFSSYLAGANEYMAMEKLLLVLDDPECDLVILDTPPTRHALDFLNAPARLTDALDGPIIRAMGKMVSGTGRFSLDLAARGAATLLRGFGKVTGAGTLEQVATLIAELNVIFGGFRERAKRVAAVFLDPSFAYVIVVRPEAGAVDDGLFFLGALADRNMAVSAIVANRVNQVLDQELLSEGLSQLRTAVSDEQFVCLERAVQEHGAREESEVAQLARLRAATYAQGLTPIELPALPLGVKNLEALSELSAVFVETA